MIIFFIIKKFLSSYSIKIKWKIINKFSSKFRNKQSKKNGRVGRKKLREWKKLRMVVEMNCKGRGAFTNVTLNFFISQFSMWNSCWYWIGSYTHTHWFLNPWNNTPATFLWGNKVSFELSTLVLYLVHFFQIVYYSFFYTLFFFIFCLSHSISIYSWDIWNSIFDVSFSFELKLYFITRLL